jgi:hypothetical protein
MPTLADITPHELLTVQDGLRAGLRDASSFEAGAQRYTEAVYRAFGGEIALSRMFLSLPFKDLPEGLRRSAWSVVEGQAAQAHVAPTTPVLTLVGTYGDEAEWRDRRASRGHAAIPLCSATFVDSIPMVAAMLQEMGVPLGLDRETGRFVKNMLGVGWVGLFYVEDARTARDGQGRRVIPSAGFVDRHHIRTVFGLGKAYGNGAIAAYVGFTKKLIPKEKVEALIPFVNLFKASTIELVQAGRYFEPTNGPAEPQARP